MIINSMQADGYKNLENVDISFNSRMNIICGENAQGKTNLIEAIWLCSGVKSFRRSQPRDYIAFDRNRMQVRLEFKDSFRQQEIKFSMEKPNEKAVFLNGVKQENLSRLFGNLNCVVFTPEDLELSKGTPDKRREFIDLSVSQIKNSYKAVVSRYEQVLSQRNFLLKNILKGRKSKSNLKQLDVWDIQMAQLGAYITAIRCHFVRKLSVYAGSIYNEITSGKENLSIFYRSTVFENPDENISYDSDLANEYLKSLSSKRNADLRAGFTTLGVHRDELETRVDGRVCKEYGSQGQCRSVSLALKLAQAYILTDEKEDAPVILLDDVLSELDRTRREYILSKIKDMQVFLTCCDEEILGTVQNNLKKFKVESGRVSEV